MLVDQVFGIAVGDCAGFANQGLVLQLPACHLLVDVLQAEKESAVAEPAPERSSVSPVTPLAPQTLLREEDDPSAVARVPHSLDMASAHRLLHRQRSVFLLL